MILRVLRSSAAQRLIGNVRPISRSSAAQRVIGNVRPFSIFVRQHQVIGNANNQPISRNFSSTDAVSKGSSKCSGFGRDLIANIAASIGPSVVRVHVPKGRLGFIDNSSEGSGMVINNKGLILTCRHVVWNLKVPFNKTDESKRTGVEITFFDGTTCIGSVIGFDSDLDVALVQLTLKEHAAFPPIELGTSRYVRQGDWAVSFGAPLFLMRTVTVGIISCADRATKEFDCTGEDRIYFQTDCALTLGSSGGPLVNLDGQVIGMNFSLTLHQEDINGYPIIEQGFAFSIPIDYVHEFLSEQFPQLKHELALA